MGVQSTLAGPAARILSPSLDATNGAILRHEARGAGLLVLTAGPVQPFYRRYPTAPVAASRSDLTARGFWPSSFGRGPDRGTGRLETMTRSTRDLPVRRRGELSRDRTIHRVSSAIDALRRLNAREADGTPTRAAPVGPSDPRYAHPPQSRG